MATSISREARSIRREGRWTWLLASLAWTPAPSGLIFGSQVARSALCVGVALEAPLLADGQSGLELDRLEQNSTTPAYQRAALEVLLKEVNSVAHEMRLHESFPIRTQDLVEARMNTAFLSDHAGFFGSI